MITITTFKWVLKLLGTLVVFLVMILFVAAIVTEEENKRKRKQPSEGRDAVDDLVARQDKDVELDKED